MRALIKGGLFLALGWLTNTSHAQDWRASTTNNPHPTGVVPAKTTDAPGNASGIRTVNIGQPTQLDGGIDTGIGSFRPVARGQAPEDKPAPLPRLVIGGGDQQSAKPLPKDKTFDPLPAAPMPPMSPSPIFDSLGLNEDSCCVDACRVGRLRGAHWRKGWGNGCDPDRGTWWIDSEILLWWQRGISVPALVTSSPAGQTENIGVLGDARNSVLYDGVPNYGRGGARYTIGTWLPRFCNVGLETRYFLLATQNTSSTYTSEGGNPQLARPFYNVDVPAADAEFSTPGQPFTTTIQTYSQLWGIEGNVRHRLHCGPRGRIDFLWGYRHLNMSESVEITETSTQQDFFGAIGQTMEQESFRTRTQFNGFQIGLDSECRFWSRCFIGARATLAMGSSHHIVNIDGTSTFTPINPGGAVSSTRGALLASSTNIGQYTGNRFAVLPEIGLKVGLDLTDHVRIYAGYDFLYLSSVVRPGDQIDLNVSQTYRPFVNPLTGRIEPGVGGGPRAPQVLFKTNDYWATGFNFGMQFRY